MFHRITLEAGKLNDARLVKPNANASHLHEGSERPGLDHANYDELYFEKGQQSSRWKLPVAFLLYLAIGTLYYSISPGNGVGLNGVLGFHQSILIGFSVGLSQRDPAYLPDPWFSSAYILVGASLIAMNLVVIGRKIEEKASNAVFEGLKRREDYEKDMSREKPLRKRFVAFVNYNAPYLVVIVMWVIWVFFTVVWSMIATNGFDENDPEKNWSFAYALYFSISLCSSAGAFSLPSFSPMWAYGFAAVSMMIGVPLMALAISSIVIMLSQGHRFKKVKKAAWEPVQPREITSLKLLGLSDNDDECQLSKGSYVLLGLLRMGQDSGIIRYLADAYDASQERGGVMMTSHTLDVSNVNLSRCARAYFSNCADSGTHDVIDSGSNDVYDSGTNGMLDSVRDVIDSQTIDVIDSIVNDDLDSKTNDVTDSGPNNGVDDRATHLMNSGPNDAIDYRATDEMDSRPNGSLASEANDFVDSMSNDLNKHLVQNKAKRSQREKQWSVAALIDGNSPRQHP